ncbi:mannitol dehydrogenase family protein [Bordetella sp. BOR01]|uniref:mannitol dehydrogenase family protein n=1 Tax=Bordetella sp. BOR01 TaxID=2854779 RepID=UPI001C44112B|nr:mannitol dehydrogenase family protein [Bordetella sp. BOR01]MBV7483741.1 mannitol dehydrogenase family protein [Bordetella sp. BOR01]
MAPRLNAAGLARLPAGIGRPGYDRAHLRPGIVHLGIGAFHRAHQAPLTDLALAASGDLRWGIVGVSLRSPATRDALAPQDGLYTLSLRDADAVGAPRESLAVVGAVLRVLVAAENPDAVLAQIAHPDTRIVSLTVTEKGYSREPASGRLRHSDPDIVHDLAHPRAPRSAIGMLVHGLARRHRAGLPPVTLLSCDNLPSNGDTLRGLVLEFAAACNPALHDWIATHCTFPNSMVDRIVPRTADADLQRIAAHLGMEDAWPVVGEPFLEWVIEDHFAAGRPAWDQPGGARFVADAAPFEHLKLRMVNGPHSALAYLGASAGLATVSQAMADPALRGYLDTLIGLEIAPTLHAVPGVDLATLRARLLARFANPALPHRTQQIAMDGSQKLPQRLLGTVRDRLRAGAGCSRLALAVAAWMHYLRGHDEQGDAYVVQDPLAGELQARLAAAGQGEDADLRRARALVGYAPVFGDLAGHDPFIAAVACHAAALRRRGARAAAQEAT